MFVYKTIYFFLVHFYNLVWIHIWDILCDNFQISGDGIFLIKTTNLRLRKGHKWEQNSNEKVNQAILIGKLCITIFFPRVHFYVVAVVYVRPQNAIMCLQIFKVTDKQCDFHVSNNSVDKREK